VGRLVVRRLAFMLFVLWGVTLVTFLLSHVVPADPARLMAGPRATPATVERLRQFYGLNDPLWQQYVRYLSDILHGNLGFSFVTRRNVRTDIASFLPATLELAGISLFVGFLAGVVFGTWFAARRGGALDASGRVFAIVGLSLPAFWLALLLQLLFHTRLGWLPLGGQLDAGTTPPPTITGMVALDSLLTFNIPALLDSLRHLVLPVVVLAAGVYGLLLRMVRSSVIETQGEDYIRTAQGKGLSQWRVTRRHVLRNALLPAVTVLGLEFGLLAGGVFVVENIYQWPGIGNYGFRAIQASDYNAIIGVTLVIAAIYVFTNLIVDVAYLYLDPRIRYE
jgi:peptide/nickel transport system permease protein